MAGITDTKVEQALGVLLDQEAPKARAAAEYLSDVTKVVLAKLEDEANEDAKSQAARESFAKRHPDYMIHLEALRNARELDFRHRQRAAAASAVIDVWRTQQASNRGAERLR